ncbi:MAG TPA: hypothetical protein VE032_02630 [Actinomycetota bacterium]|nr:hypothetical protein [Actinomycetota bacterium]
MDGKRFVIAGLVAGTMLAGAVPAHANDADVIRRGSCSGASDWKLKLSPEDGRIEVEFEVDQDRVGQTWAVRIVQDGQQIFAGRRITRAPSGSFEVELRAQNTAGDDTFRASARNVSTGETCVGRATF